MKPFSLKITSLLVSIFLSLHVFSATPESANNTKQVTAKTVESKVVNPQYRIDTNQGSFTIELFPNEAPKTVANFIKYIDDGFYTDTIFHRMIPGFVIQGGGFDESFNKKKTRAPIVNESTTTLKNKLGTLSMARMSAPNTATSQFFISLKDNTSLDKSLTQKGYAVFGRVIQGMPLLERLSHTPTGNIGMYQDVPKSPIIITRITKLSTSNN